MLGNQASKVGWGVSVEIGRVFVCDGGLGGGDGGGVGGLWKTCMESFDVEG